MIKLNTNLPFITPYPQYTVPISPCRTECMDERLKRVCLKKDDWGHCLHIKLYLSYHYLQIIRENLYGNVIPVVVNCLRFRFRRRPSYYWERIEQSFTGTKLSYVRSD